MHEPFSLTPALSRWERELFRASPQRGEVGRGELAEEKISPPFDQCQ
jgi:hypothetical protein